MTTRDLAVPELITVEVRGMSRSAFLLRSALAAGAIYGGAAVGPFVHAMAQQEVEEGGGDLGILNFALTLEHVEAAFYDMALTRVSGLSGELRELTALLARDEKEHVEFLRSAVSDARGRPVGAPSVSFGTAFASTSSYLRVAQTLEETGVSAYNGAGPQLQAKKLLAAAGSIVQVEGRHAALIRLARGEEPAPTALDESLEQGEVMRAVDPFLS